MIASQASRFLVEARRSGLTDLLLGTPLTASQIVRGQWRALTRMFGPPLALFLAAQLAGGLFAQDAMWKQIAAAAPTGPAGPASTNAPAVTFTNSTGVTTTISVGGFAAPGRSVALVTSLTGTLTLVADLLALVWFGMWMGLNSKTTTQATLKTIAFVEVIPWFVVGFASALVVPVLMFSGFIGGAGSMSSQMMMWFPLLTAGLSTALYLAKDIAFVVWSRRKLHREFRQRVAQGLTPVRVVTPSPLPATVPAPPLVTASR